MRVKYVGPEGLPRDVDCIVTGFSGRTDEFGLIEVPDVVATRPGGLLAQVDSWVEVSTKAAPAAKPDKE